MARPKAPILFLVLFLVMGALKVCAYDAEVSTPGTAGVGLAMSAPLSIDNMRPQVKKLLTECGNMTPAQFEISYMQVVTRAQTGAIEWSQLAVFRASHRELRDFARRTAEEQTSLNNQLTTYLSNWYNITQIIEPLSVDSQTLCGLSSLSGREFEVAYMNAMIAHLEEMRALSDAVAVSAPHELLRQTALQTAAFYSQRTNQLRQWLADWYGVT